MTEATWGGSTSHINWRMSAALENVPRGDTELAEVTNLESAVRAWLVLDMEHRNAATLTTEHALLVDGASVTEFSGDGIAWLAKLLPGNDPADGAANVDDAG